MGIPVINGAFAGQRVTGQQRYATEIAAELESGYAVRRISGAGGASAWRAWYESQTMPRKLERDELLVTLTSRGPIRSSRQVVVVHDVFVLERPEWFSRRYVLTHRPVLIQQLRSAAGLIAVSDATAQALRRHVPAGRAVAVAPNAPAGIFLRPPPENERRGALERWGLTEGRFFLCVGSLDPRKNLESLVKAHLALPESVRREYPLVVVGAKGSAFGRTEIPSDRSVLTLGYVSDGELSALYRAASAVLFGSLDEGFGLPVAESLAVGARLIVSDIAVFRWVAGTHAALVPARDIEGWTRAMRDAVESGQISQSERDARRQWISTRFSWEASARTIMDYVSAL